MKINVSLCCGKEQEVKKNTKAKIEKPVLVVVVRSQHNCLFMIQAKNKNKILFSLGIFKKNS